MKRSPSTPSQVRSVSGIALQHLKIKFLSFVNLVFPIKAVIYKQQSLYRHFSTTAT